MTAGTFRGAADVETFDTAGEKTWRKLKTAGYYLVQMDAESWIKIFRYTV